ncbi:hypothetical protein Q5425_29800 [Amycolatopsis sp. A133]|uniref:hypothetical protein n=1 Tax=Amycolatopsis sp. A133 TaxID=3064472 RepID=UPI0027F616C8|nr:hypothetical protein [Amycolatopsis sp. A133]MDQ7807952.1 hypothetical protein [Amycolatopsis sp. A133]
MHRESDRHPRREDDALEAEPRGTPQGNDPSPAEEQQDPELPADVPPLGGGA